MENSLPAAGRRAFALRMQALDAGLLAAREQGSLAGLQVRDTSNRSGRDWPWWSVEISCLHVSGADSCRLAAMLHQACTAAEDVGDLVGSWRAEVWSGVAANRLDRAGRQPLTYQDLATPPAFRATVAQLLQQARAALATAQQPPRQ